MKEKEEKVLELQIEMAMFLMNHWGVDNLKFLEIEQKYGIFAYIDLCYEPFHLTGEMGVAEEIEAWLTLPIAKAKGFLFQRVVPTLLRAGLIDSPQALISVCPTVFYR